MNINKFNENINDIPLSKKAKILGEKLENKFFNGLDEYRNISIEKDYILYVYKFYFDILYSETITAINAIDTYMGYNHFQIETEISNDYNESLMFYWFKLDESKINKYLKMIEIEENAKKYNL